MSKYAPVLVMTLNRYDHFRRCVDTLSACTFANKTDIYIALDFPLNDSHWEGYDKISKYIKKMRIFKNVQVIKREINFGAANNFFEALTEIFKEHGRVIISEDDNEFSINFLHYINRGLNVYQDRRDIFSVCGYNYPVSFPRNYPEEIYLWSGFSAWGSGIWREKWEKVDWTCGDLRNYLSDSENVSRVLRIAEHLYPALKRVSLTGNMLGDAILSYHQIVHDMYTVFPVISRVRNTGNDGTGMHCGIDEKYLRQKILQTDARIRMPSSIQPNALPYRILYNHFKVSRLRSFASSVKSRLLAETCRINAALRTKSDANHG